MPLPSGRIVPAQSAFLIGLKLDTRLQKEMLADVRYGSFATETRPATAPAMSVISLKAEVKSGYWHLPRWAFVG
jgi:hypothetical protein